jgi:hypothetical protein
MPTRRRAWSDRHRDGTMRHHVTTLSDRLKLELTEHVRDGYRGVTMFSIRRGDQPGDRPDVIYWTASEVEDLRRLLNWARKSDAEHASTRGRPA